MRKLPKEYREDEGMVWFTRGIAVFMLCCTAIMPITMWLSSEPMTGQNIGLTIFGTLLPLLAGIGMWRQSYIYRVRGWHWF